MITYKPLRKLLIDKEINITSLRENIKLSSTTIAKLNSDKIVSLSIIDKICQYFDCEIEDIMKYERKK